MFLNRVILSNLAWFVPLSQLPGAASPDASPRVARPGRVLGFLGFRALEMKKPPETRYGLRSHASLGSLVPCVTDASRPIVSDLASMREVLVASLEP